MCPQPLDIEASLGDDSPVAGQVWELSRDPAGCRRVQRALEIATSEEERCELARELRGHVLEAMRCPHGNHVLQKCVKTMRPESLQFIVDALEQQEGSAAQAARHKYACRVIQHLLAECPPAQVGRIAEGLLGEASALACHSFGHHALKCLMLSGSAEHRYRLARCVERNAASMCRSAEGCSVIETAIKEAAPEDAVWIARAVAQDPQDLLAISGRRRGWSCALHVLETLPREELDRAGLAECLETLRTRWREFQIAQGVGSERCRALPAGLVIKQEHASL